MTGPAARPVSPGEVLLAELGARGWSQRDLADVLKRPTQAINEVIRGTKQVTAETAIQLESAFGIAADSWLQLEARYRVALARERRGHDDIARRARVYSLLPVGEAQRRGWIPHTDSLAELERAVCRFLGMRSIDDEPETPVNLRSSMARGPDIPSQRAWIKRVEQLARAQRADSPPRLDALSTSLLELTAEAQGVASVPHVVRRHGVRLVLLPHLPKTFLDGAAFLIRSEAPVIALSLRYDRIDNFWFTLFHELGHLRRGHDRILEQVVGGPGAGTDRQESAVNRAAAEALVPAKALDAFLTGTKRPPSLADITAFAAGLGRHPGIVVGRLQREGVIAWSENRPLLTGVRGYLKAAIEA